MVVIFGHTRKNIMSRHEYPYECVRRIVSPLLSFIILPCLLLLYLCLKALNLLVRMIQNRGIAKTPVISVEKEEA